MLNSIFVFESNLAGRHAELAAYYALMRYGALYGQGEGRQGQSYAIPTKDAQMQTLHLSEIENAIRRFAAYAAEHRREVFMLTPIGCGLAGHAPNQIWNAFHRVKLTGNVLLKPSWVNDHQMPDN